MEKELISVIVPVYKVEKYLEKCVNSIANQTYKNLEIILVDDGSPDNCPAMCDSLAKTDGRIKVVHKKNGGVSSARNEGLKVATGKFVTFVDSDDYLLSSYYEDMINLVDNSTDLVVSNIKIITKKGSKDLGMLDNEKISHVLDSPESFMQFVISGFFDNVYNKLYKKDLILKEFDTSLKLGEDRVFNLNYFENINGKIKYSNYAGYIYENNPTSACKKTYPYFFEMISFSITAIKVFLNKKFGTFDNYYYFKEVESLFYNCAKKVPKSEHKGLKHKLKNSELVQEYINLYKPKTLEDKVKYFLIKHNMINLYNLLSK